MTAAVRGWARRTRRLPQRPAAGAATGLPAPGDRIRSRDDPERDDPEAVARLICLRMLTAAPRTQAQLAAALRRRGVPEDAAQAVLARFAEVKLIDDAMFARAWVESRHHGRGLAGRALGAELRQRASRRRTSRRRSSELDPEQETRDRPGPGRAPAAGHRWHAGPGPDAPACRRAGAQGLGPPAWRTGSCARRWSRRPRDAGRSPYYLDEMAEPGTEAGSGRRRAAGEF